MIHYKRVIENRYDKQKFEELAVNGFWAITKSVGYANYFKTRKVFIKIIRQLIRLKLDILNASFLDIGCGNGDWTRFILEIIGNPSKITGIDYSQKSIEYAKKMNPAISYYIGDMTDLSQLDLTYTIITSFVSLMHIEKKEQLKLTLGNINKKLKKNGYFIWYDKYAQTHYKSTLASESQGFNQKEMDELCKSSGLEFVFSKTVYKNPFGLINNHTAYLRTKFPEFIVNIFELMPGTPGNMFRIYKKQ